MQAVLPGKPQSKLQAFDTVSWEGRRIIAYISRNVLIILRGPRDLVQTIILDDRNELTAVAIDRATGKIAVSTATTVHIYRPYGHEYAAAVQWSLLCDYMPSYNEALIQCLSWGLPNELLIGGSALTLLATSDEPKETWTRKLANPARHAVFSHDASLIASTGEHDRLAKIWRRLFFGSDNERFDAAYLSHPSAVTGLWWRDRPDAESHTASVLYTICADNKLRVWTDVNSHCVQILDLWHELDLLACIQPRSTPSPEIEPRRYVFTINSWDVKSVIEDAAANANEQDEREHHHLKHLQELAAKDMEVCVVLDNMGNMSAWGLERVGHKARQTNDVLNIAYAEDAHLAFASDLAADEDFVQLCCFPSSSKDGAITLLAHHFSGKIDWMSCRLDRLFDPMRQSDRIHLETPWTGHSASLKRFILNPSDPGSFLALTDASEAVVWHRPLGATSATLTPKSLLTLPEPAIDGAFLQGNAFVVILIENQILIWNTTSRRATLVCKATVVQFRTAGHSCLVASTSCLARDIVSTISPNLQSQSWVFDRASDNPHLVLVSSSLEPSRQASIVVKSHVAEPSSFMSRHASDGSVDHWVLVSRPDETGKIASVELKHSKRVALGGINEFRFIAPAGQHYVAITSELENSVSVYNMDTGCLELKRAFADHEPIKWVTWGAASKNVCVLGIVLPHKIHILCQARVNHRQEQAPWLHVQMIDLKLVTPHEADVAMWHPWSNRKCHLVVDTITRQMFDYYSAFDMITKDANGKFKTTKHDMVQVAAQLNTALPIIHPTMLTEMISLGQLDAVESILVKLEKELKYFTDDQLLHSSLDMDIDTLFKRPSQTNRHRHQLSNGDNTEEFSDATVESLLASLDKLALPNMSKTEQTRLRHFIQSMGSVRAHRQSIDSFGARYLVEFEYKRNHLSKGDIEAATWREIVWAQHSASQEILLDLTTRHLDNKLSWRDAKSTGMFMWMTDLEALKSRFEVVARTEYASTEERNPVDCSLHYIALRKKTALAGLWRMATWNRERTATMKLLANNFDDPRWKSAALKNAYALLGRHRAQYAAAFFLLAGNLKDCVNVLANQLGDLQLAIAVARIYEGTEHAGPVLSELIQVRILPQAARSGDVWLAVWAFTMLGQHKRALAALTLPLADIIIVEDPPPEPKSFSYDDPSLAQMYAYLRDKQPKAAWDVSERAERDLVMRAAKTYSRMGCDILGLDLLRAFVFKHRIEGATPPKAAPGTSAPDKTMSAVDGEQTSEQPSALDAFTSMDISHGTTANGKDETKPSMTVNGAPRKVVNEEPSAASILDSFDF